MRTIAIGDVHGCARALETLLAALELEREDRLVFLGDLVDRGPDSFAVVDRVRQLCVEGRAVCVFGNHEQMLIEAQDSHQDLVFWMQVGGREALESYEARSGELAVTEEHLSFLADACLPIYEDEGFIYAHAGIDPDVPLAEQSMERLRWYRFSDEGPHPSGRTLVVGHTPQKDGLPRDLGHALCIDTYCYGGQFLTAFDTTMGRFVQANEAGHLRSFSRADLQTM